MAAKGRQSSAFVVVWCWFDGWVAVAVPAKWRRLLDVVVASPSLDAEGYVRSRDAALVLALPGAFVERVAEGRPRRLFERAV